jgi:hypothetical protein
MVSAPLCSRKSMNIAMQNCTLLVSSCDRYEDLWEPYFSLLNLYWPDCPFPVVLITEKKRPVLPNIRALCLGAGLDWSTLLLNALNTVGTPYVLLTLEDFFLRRKVCTPKVVALFDQLQQESLRMLRLTPRPGPNFKLNSSEYGGIEPNAPYKVSTQAAFWEVETLKKLLTPGESAWEFEINASLRSVELTGFVAVWREALPYRHHVVEKGKWFPWDYWKFSRMNIGVKSSAREVMTTYETLMWILRKLVSPVVRHVRVRLRRTCYRRK